MLQDASVASLAGEVKELDSQVAELARSMPAPPAGSNRTCTWKGQRVTCSRRRRHRRRLSRGDEGLRRTPGEPHRPARRAAGQSGRRAGQTGVSGLAEASNALLEAKQAFEEKAGQSPVWRLTAAVFGEPVSDVTPAQFARVKGFVTATLAIGFATLSHGRERGRARAVAQRGVEQAEPHAPRLAGEEAEADLPRRAGAVSRSSGRQMDSL